MGAPLRYSTLLVAALLAPQANLCAAAAPMLGAGDRHSISVDVSGTVRAWGNDNAGQLGTRAVYSTIAKPVVELDSVTQVYAGRLHGLARRSDGTVRAWGYNSTGALGDGTSTNRVRPVMPAIDNVSEVFGGGHQSFARKNDGTLWAWGDNTTGQLGDGTHTTRYTPVPIPAIGTVAKVAVGFGHTIALKGDGTVWTWGANARGQLGTGPGPDRTTPMQVAGLTGVVAVSSGVTGTLSVALKNDGTVWTWGGNDLGGLGDGNPIPSPDRNVPGQVVGLTDVVAIACGRLHVVALKNDGTVWAWGQNAAGQLGAGAGPPRSTPVQVTGLTSVAQIAAGRGHSLARLTDGTVVAWGANEFGEVGDGTTTDRFAATPVPQVGVVSAISAGDGMSYALLADGRVLAWGSDLNGSLGDGGPLTRTVPRPVPSISDVVTVSAGQGINIVLRNDGTAWAWGSGVEGALGDGTFFARATAQPVINLPVVAQAIAGGQHGLARTAAGVVYAWGLNNVGQLGDGTNTTRNQAVPVIGVTAKSLGAGYRHSIAVAPNGTLWTWGWNGNGQLGDGTIADRSTPAQVPGLSGVFDAATGGMSHTLALRSDGTVWAWGSNQLGELGDGTLQQRTAPVQVSGLANVIAISAGDRRSMALKSDGTVWAWGGSPLGDGTNVSSATPKQVPGLANVASIACGYFHMSAMLADGSVRTWGDNLFGQMGDGTYVNRNAQVVVSADDGGGSLDANNWYLDLAPAIPTTIPAAQTPAALAVAQASGEDDQLSLTASVKYKAADNGKKLNTYVLAIVPAEFFGLVKKAPGTKSVRELKAQSKSALILAQLTPQGWTDVNGQLIAYAQGVGNAAGGAASILNGVNTTLIPGARFCVGYGESADAMLSAQGMREVLSLEGSGATTSGVPCVLSGVYVSGPPGSVSGSQVSFTATVVGLSPTGSVSFRDGFATLGSSGLASANPAVAKGSVATASLIVGTHSISAVYSGDAQNAAASTAIAVLHEVSSAQGGVRVDLSGPASSDSGSEAVFSAMVIGNQATGNVQFLDSGSPVAVVPLVEGTATLRIGSLAIGNHSIAASYSGDGGNTPGTSSAIAHVVLAVPAATRVTLTPSTASPKVGTQVTFTASVAGTSPTGSVRFRDSASDFSGAVPLASGQAQYVIASLAAGSHAITAQYSGDGSNPPVTSDTAVVNVILELDAAQANADTDGDAIPNGVELAEGTNPSIRDNDVFASARLFAMQQYRDFLGREGDAGGIAAWSGNLNSGVQSRAQVIESFFGSQEFQGTIAPVARLYFAYFLRVPDYAGLNFWIGYYRAGNSLDAISNFFAGSPEFINTYGSLDNAGFVNLVYQNVLGRAPDAGGFAYWKGLLDTGTLTRGQVMLGFSESDEYRGNINNEVYVTMAYSGMLRRAPDAGGFGFWVQYMDSGNSGLALLNGFLASAEYHSRFLP